MSVGAQQGADELMVQGGRGGALNKVTGKYYLAPFQMPQTLPNNAK